MFITKNRINNLSCIQNIADGKKIVVALQDGLRFRDILIKLGFSGNLIDGERVLPATLNPTLKRNAESFYIVDKSKPKEKYWRTLLWTRFQWNGRNNKKEVTSFVDIPGERYPRIYYEPYGVELALKYDEQGKLMVLTEPISYTHENGKLLLNSINIFLTCFGECQIMTDNLQDMVPQRTIRLNWSVLPKGKFPWIKLKSTLEKVTSSISKTDKALMYDRCEFINSFQPDFCAYGNAGFNGYVILGFSNRNIYVLESIHPNNATYILGKDWKELSKLTKAEIISGNLCEARVIHNASWKAKMRDYLEVK